MHFERLPSGSWRVSVRHQGQRASTTRTTKAAAQQAGAEMLIRLGATPKAGPTMTVGELVDQWFAQAELSATYRADVASVLHRLPAPFRARRLDQLSPLVIEACYRQLTDPPAGAGRPLSAHRVARLHAVLSAAWTFARRYGWATTNPFEVVRKPRPAPRDVRPPTDDELDRLAANTPKDLLLYEAVAETIGARRSELVALQWGDIDLETMEIVIRRARTYAGGRVEQRDGKIGRKGHRVVAIDRDLVDWLRAHRVRQVEAAVLHGLPGPVWVFSHDLGLHPWHPEHPTKRFARVRAVAGVPAVVKLHGYRHAMATRVLAAGVPAKVLQGRLGHTRTATTTDVYAHHLPAADRAASDVIAQSRRTRAG